MKEKKRGKKRRVKKERRKGFGKATEMRMDVVCAAFPPG